MKAASGGSTQTSSQTETPGSGRLPEAFVLLVFAITSLPGIAILLGLDFGIHTEPDRPLYIPVSDISQLHAALRGSFLHTLLEWSAVMIALIYVVFSILDYRLRRDPVALVIGVTLLCAATTDIFHTLAADRLILHVNDHASFIPFTWALSRMAGVLVLAFGLGMLLRRHISDESARPVILFALLAVSLSVLTSWLSVGALALPEVQLEDSLITRPFDVLPLVLYVAVVPLLARLLDRRHGNFVTHALLLSLIPAIMTQVHMAFGSQQLFDAHFNAGHFLKAFSYMVPLIGLFAEYGAVAGKLQDRERALAEQASILANSNRRLFREIQDRELAEQKITEHAERLRMSNEELEQFAFIASHDLREPLRKILIYCSRLERNPLINEDASVRGIVDSVAASGRRMMGLLESLQQYTAISGQDELREDVPLNEIMREISQVLAPLVERTGANLVIDDLPELRQVNRAQMLNLFQHLIENALTYVREGVVPEVRVRLRSAAGGDKVVIHIEDNGPGIEPRFQEKVFQIFQRLDPDHRKHSTGVGLTLCRRICHRHGGDLLLESEPGEGCRFIVEIPGTPLR